LKRIWKNKKTILCLTSVLLAIVIVFGGFFIYVQDYYRADFESIEAFVADYDVKKTVETLTDKPYDVVVTHMHGDHNGGSDQFETVWMHPADIALVPGAAAMGDPEVYRDGEKAAAIAREHQAAKDKLDALYEEWEELTDAAETYES